MRFLVALLLSVAFATVATQAAVNVPVVAWSNHPDANGRPNHLTTDSQKLALGPVLNKDLCTADGARVVLFLAHGTHFNDLTTNKHAVQATDAHNKARAGVAVDYFMGDPEAVVRDRVTKLCGSKEAADRIVKVKELLSVSSARAAEKLLDADHAQDRNTVYVFAGMPQKAHLAKRQAPAPSLATTRREIHFLGQYSIFSPALFQGLLAFGFIVVILLFGFSWVASVEAPARMEGRKGKDKRV